MNTQVLDMMNISKQYKQHKALDNVSLCINKGDIYGFIGQNGAGKTTLIRLITGLSFPSSGSFKLFGTSSEKNKVKARKNVGAIVETPALYRHMTAYDNLA